VDRAHVSVDRPGALGPPWTDASADNGHGGTLTEARPPAALVRRSSSTGAQNGEGGTGSSIRASPELERHRGGRATTGKARWCRRSVRGRLELLERENESGERCGEARGECSPFIGAGESRGGVAERLTPTLMALMPLKALSAVNARFEGD
jgi:hypothetical protein